MKISKIFKNLSLAFLLLWGLYLLVVNAWLNDDAFISFRSVKNAIDGYGLRWNTFERVQAYTHPLWLFLLIASNFFVSNLYTVSFVLSALTTFGAIFFVKSVFANVSKLYFVTFLGLLIGSKAFLEYSNSGLENPLSHLLLAILAYVLFANDDLDYLLNKVKKVAFIFALAYLTRPDLVIIVFVPLTYLFFAAIQQNFKKTIKVVLIGFTPAIIWTAFSILYYGVPFPNTAYAKLGTRADSLLLYKSGINYLLNSFDWDPLSLSIISISCLVTLIWGRRLQRCLSLSILLYIIYLIKIGGDYMSGRFISAPFFIANINLLYFICNLEINAEVRSNLLRKYAPSILSGFLALGVFSSIFNPKIQRYPQQFKDKIYSRENVLSLRTVADSRLFFYQTTGLIPIIKNSGIVKHRLYRQGQKMRASNQDVFNSRAIGMHGYCLKPEQRIIDVYGLSDPLIARLPTRNPKVWRIGHFMRKVPDGYFASLKTFENRISDPDLKQYYEIISKITRDPIFSFERFKLIIKFNLGRYDYLRENFLMRQCNQQPRKPCLAKK